MPHFMSATEANTLALQASNAIAQGVLSNLTDALVKIEAEALRGKNFTFFEGFGQGVKLPQLIAELQALGYFVNDVSNKPTGTGTHSYLDRSITVSW